MHTSGTVLSNSTPIGRPGAAPATVVPYVLLTKAGDGRCSHGTSQTSLRYIPADREDPRDGREATRRPGVEFDAGDAVGHSIAPVPVATRVASVSSTVTAGLQGPQDACERCRDRRPGRRGGVARRRPTLDLRRPLPSPRGTLMSTPGPSATSGPLGARDQDRIPGPDVALEGFPKVRGGQDPLDPMARDLLPAPPGQAELPSRSTRTSPPSGHGPRCLMVKPGAASAPAATRMPLPRG